MPKLVEMLARQPHMSATSACRRFAIGVVGESEAPSGLRLFTTLASIFPVDFRSCIESDCDGLDAVVVLGLDPERIRMAASTGLPVFAVAAQPSTAAARKSTRIRFGDDAALSACWRGYCCEVRDSAIGSALEEAVGDVVLAWQDGVPIWTQRRVVGVNVMMAALPLPLFTERDFIHDYLWPSELLHLLPLLQFLRNLTRAEDWQSPPTPACLVVDDPNLHLRTYGYLDFQRLADDAWAQNFFVSIAMVPLDSWWIGREVREIFRQNAPRISILLHGNNHTYEELACPASEAEILSLLSEALRRMERLENEAGMEVCRVMECPHCAIAEDRLEPMAKLGYEAALASTAYFLKFNPDVRFRSELGAEPTLLTEKAVPILPRIQVYADWETDVRLAAFLRQPMFLATHHWDFAHGSHVVQDFAEIVNSLPDVCWASPKGAARACYQFRQVGDVLHIKLGSRLVDVAVGRGMRKVVVHRPWLHGKDESELMVLRGESKELFRAVSSAAVIGPISLDESTVLELSSSLLDKVDSNSVSAPPRRYWPLVRRFMAEVRDRSLLGVYLRGQVDESNGRRARSCETGDALPRE